MVALLRLITSPRVVRPLFWLLVAFTLTMAFLPQPPSLPIDDMGDKFEHMLAFFVLSAVALVGWPQTRRWRLILLLSALGVVIEVVQGVPELHRDADWRDWAADTLAIVAAVAAVSPLVRWLRLQANGLR